MNRLTEILGTKYPIIQGAMQYVANANLAAAVSNSGGLGVIAGGGITAKQLEAEINKARELTDKPFAVNINLQYPNVSDLVKVILEQGIKIVTTGAGTPKYYMNDFKEAGVAVIPVVPNLKIAQKMEALGAAAVIAEGRESGAHIGKNASLVLWPEVIANLSIPVIAAGGIANRKGVKAAIAMGAAGVQCGTVFSIANESPVGDNWREVVLHDENEPATLVLGMPAIRVLNTPHAQELAQAKLDQKELSHQVDEDFLPAMQKDDLDHGIIFAGEVVSLLTKKQSAQEIVDELAQGL
ncbi:MULTISPECIES: nitronate monooxygenase [Lactobacillus]|uniref:Probable nitronate monooxygenase n=1 Tax=Lactobacillus xujianguonis TaxID=2495899 RepID=A0A437SW76_9LACO|nr:MULTISPECIES: nitronate monooxygenase [Lactobacillus]RVU71163.1 enoyl-[acyl-carrier-protein] reductase FabK [Lactobacillus xujianguonis]RVU77510.1 enoyl-[acyl-carrier-protein] reductase FabK [Lactobacillus xujianguonis]